MKELFQGEKIKVESINKKGFCDYWNPTKNRFCLCKSLKNTRFCRFHTTNGMNSKYIFPNIELEERYDKYEKPIECPVCFDEWTIDDTRPLECGHWVHVKCVCKSIRAECPICRKKLTKLTPKQMNIINSNRARYDMNMMNEDMETAMMSILEEIFVNNDSDDMVTRLRNNLIGIEIDSEGNVIMYANDFMDEE